MILRNNSKNEWLNYHQGIDILPESTFEVPEKEGKFILRLLGHPNWVVEVGSDEVIAKIEEVEAVEEIEGEAEVVEKLPTKRPEIMKELKKRGIKFEVKMKNDELIKLLK